MDEYDLCNQPKREARREVVKKDLCEKGYKKRTQQNRIYYVVQGVNLSIQSKASLRDAFFSLHTAYADVARRSGAVALTFAGDHRRHKHS